jgi:hypothetical protein
MRRMRTSLMGAALGVMLALPAAAEGLPATAPLFQTIRQLDRSLFDASNTCDIASFSELIADDLEFYHDKTGLSTGKASLVAATEKNICRKVRRELVEASLEVYPLANYGAMEVGRHTFCNLVETPVCAPNTNGDGRFIMLWRKDGDGYKLARVISYDHVSSWERDQKAAPPR